MSNSCDREFCPVSKDGHCQEADRAAEAAVKKTFAIMGVDIDDPKQVAAFQKQLYASHTLNKLIGRGGIVIFVAVVGAGTTYILKSIGWL